MSVIAVSFLVLGQQSTQLEATPAAAASVPGPQPTHTVTFVQVTGLGQYPPAKTAAQGWAADAQLVSANATWPKVIGKENVGEPIPWTYHFYSASKQRLFFVSVNPDGPLQTIEHLPPVSLPPEPIITDSWVIDSPAALAIWLDNGGAKMVGSNPGLEMLVQLRSLHNQPNPVWMVVGLSNQTEEVHTVVIDANQGLVTLTQPGS